MQRVEPAEVRTFEDPVPPGRPAPKAVPKDDKKNQAPLTADLPAVEAEPAQKPEGSGSVVFWAAFLFSGLWIAGVGAYVVGLIGIEKALTLSNEWYVLVGAVTIVPVALAFFVALLAREAMVLRRHSSALAAAASQLAEPEELAAKNLARLSRAIRRELDTFNTALEAASGKMASLETSANERLAIIERTALAAQERVERATNRLGSEREKLAQFTQALDTVVLAASETLTTRLKDARAAARAASESLHAEHGAIAGLISTLQSASHAVSAKALETSKEIEKQAQRLDAASEAAAARSEQVVARHERQRAALAETIDRLKQENDHMARALDYQREGMNKLVASMAEENKKIGTFTVEGARRLDDAANMMAQRIVETTQLFSREAEKLRTSTELTTSGLESAMQTIRSAGDNSFDAAGRLGSVLVGLRDTATTASQQIEGTVGRLNKLLTDVPSEAAGHISNLRNMIEQQAQAMADLQAKVGAAFDRVNAIDLTRHAAPQEPLPNLHMQPQIQHHAPQQLAHHAQPAPVYTPPPPPAPVRQPVQHMQPHSHMPAPPMQPQQHTQPVQPPQPTQPYGADPRQRQFPMARPDADILSGEHQKSLAPQPQRDPVSRNSVPHFRAPPMQDDDEPNFNVPPPGAQVPLPGYSQSRNNGSLDRPAAQADGSESRGWFGLAKKLVRPSDDGSMGVDDRGNWDMKSLLAAAADSRDSERRTLQGQSSPPVQRPIEVPRHERSSQFQPPPAGRVQPAPQLPQRPPALPAGRPQNRPGASNGGADLTGGAPTSSRHMIETLQAMAIDLSRFLEDDPPVELLRRYRNGERNVFARRLATMLGAEHMRIIARKYQEDREFRETVDRYIHQFEALLEQTARSDRENVLVETYLTSQTGKVYVTLASAIGRLS